MEIACDGGRDGRVASNAREKSRGGALTQRRRADDRKKEWSVVGLGRMWACFFLIWQVKMVNYWRGTIISLDIYFRELPNHKIWQAIFTKLLEML
jgi:hypothetical protein